MREIRWPHKRSGSVCFFDTRTHKWGFASQTLWRASQTRRTRTQLGILDGGTSKIVTDGGVSSEEVVLDQAIMLLDAVVDFIVLWLRGAVDGEDDNQCQKGDQHEQEHRHLLQLEVHQGLLTNKRVELRPP